MSPTLSLARCRLSPSRRPAVGAAHCAIALPGTTYRSDLPANLARDVAFYCVWFTVRVALPLCYKSLLAFACCVYGPGGAQCTIGSWWAGLSVAISYLLVFILSCTMLGRYFTQLRKISLPQKLLRSFFACDCARSCYLHAILYPQ